MTLLLLTRLYQYSGHNQLNVYASDLIFRFLVLLLLFWCLVILLLASSEASHCMRVHVCRVYIVCFILALYVLVKLIHNIK